MKNFISQITDKKAAAKLETFINDDVAKTPFRISQICVFYATNSGNAAYKFREALEAHYSH